MTLSWQVGFVEGWIGGEMTIFDKTKLEFLQLI